MSDSAGAIATSDRDQKAFFGHPRGLAVCFLTEMWERFSFYGMRALLIFYLTQHFLYGDDRAFLIYGAYIAMVYVTPVLGGIMADRYLGAKKAVTLGAILLVCGHFGMAFEGPISTMVTGADGAQIVQRDPFFLQIFYLSLALIITGVGFLKANISTIVGSLYGRDDARRDPGFTIFYMGINTGAFLGAGIAGWLGQTVGWWAGFGLAGVGMLAGLFQFRLGQRHFGGKAEPPDPERLKRPYFAGLSREHLIYAGTILAIVAIWQLMQYQELIGRALDGFGIVTLTGILIFSFWRCPKVDRDRMLVATLLILFSIVFWALFEQAGSSLNLFADRSTDRVIFGLEIPASVFQSLNSFFIITLAPFFSMLWIWLDRKKLEPSTPMKFGLGILQVGVGFLVLVFGISLSGEGQLTGLIWLVLVYFFHTTGELCLSPVGLSMVTKLSVPRVVGMMMGAWFLATAYANYLSSQIARLTGAETISGEVVDAAAATAKYADVYWQVGLIAVGIGVAIMLVSPLIRKGMHGVH